jgi:hypothetical protein
VSCEIGKGCVTPGSQPPTKPSGGVVVSCHPGTGCTTTPSNPDHDHDYDHDHGYGYGYGYGYGHDYDRWHRHFGFWRWNFPVVYAPEVIAPVEACTYEYKWASVYVPGYGLKRVVVKACAIS